MRFPLPLLVGIATVAVVAGGTLAAARSDQHTDLQPRTDQQSSLVEDFSYPGASAIEATDGVQLISGNGDILYSACDNTTVDNIGVMRVYTANGIGPAHDGTVCFRVIGTPAHIAVRIPAVYEIRGDGYAPDTGHAGTASLTTDDGTKSTVTINPSGSKPVGVGVNQNDAPTTLLAIDITG